MSKADLPSHWGSHWLDGVLYKKPSLQAGELINNYYFLWNKCFWRTTKAFIKKALCSCEIFPYLRLISFLRRPKSFFYLLIIREELFCAMPQVKCMSWNSLSSLLPFLSLNSMKVHKNTVWLKVLEWWLSKKSSFKIDFLSGILDNLHSNCSPRL